MGQVLFCSRRSDSSPEPSPRGLRKLFRKLRSKRSRSDASSSGSDGDVNDRVRIMRPRDTIVTPIDNITGGSELLLSPRSRRAELRRSGARASM